MKARVKILVNGAAATLLTGAVAAGLILSSTGALQTKNNDVLAARELDETQEEMTREQEPQTEANAELVSAERYQLGMLWEHELTAKKTTEKSTESDEKNTENEKRSSSASSAKSPLASYFSDQALVNPNTVGNYLFVCNKVLVGQTMIPAKGHSWNEGVITTAPTCKDKGVKTFTCTVCHDTKAEIGRASCRERVCHNE